VTFAVPLDILKTTLYTEVKQHTQHHDMSAEIQRLQLLERCLRRAAEEPAESLQRIFDTESQSVGNAAASTVTFGEIESSMYKRRSTAFILQLLPTDASDVAARITGTRYGMCDGQQIFFLADL